MRVQVPLVPPPNVSTVFLVLKRWVPFVALAKKGAKYISKNSDPNRI